MTKKEYKILLDVIYIKQIRFYLFIIIIYKILGLLNFKVVNLERISYEIIIIKKLIIAKTIKN